MQKVIPPSITENDMPQLPSPSSEQQMADRLDELDIAIAVSEWEDAIFTPGMRALLNRYALGEITESEYRAQIADAIGTPRLDLCH